MDVPSIPGYDVLGLIGSGGSAQVWRAHRTADDLRVALKIVPTRPGQVSAALREAGILARVRHQHVIHLYDVVPVPGEGGRPDRVALAMELADGGSLAEVLGARDHLTPGELVTVCSPLAGALAELHRAGVVHGDISPGNVLFRADGMPLLADLGVSRIAGERRGETYGTDGMVAPEVIEGFAPTAESDIYGLGALAWRSLVGDVPGWVGTRPELGELRPELPEGLVSLVTSCLSGEPSDRPEAEEVEVALYAAARPEPVALAPGADPAAGLTQRIRARRRAEDDTDEDGTGEGGTGEGGTGADARSPADSRSRTGSGRRHLHPLRRAGAPGRGTGRRRGRPVVLVAGAAAVLLIALAVATGLSSLLGPGSPPEAAREADPATPVADALGVLGSTGSDTDTPPGEESAPEQPETPTIAASSADATSDAASSAGEPPDPVASVQRLLDARAAAWGSGETPDLAAVHVAGSPAFEQEARSLEEARELGVVYQGLGFGVEGATVLASGRERVVLEVEVERSSYAEVGPRGTVQHEPSSDVVELELRLVEGDWRIWGWGRATEPQAGAGTG